MPTLSLGAPGATGTWQITNGIWAAGSSFIPANHRFGMRWASVAIPQGATITSATLTFRLSSTIGTSSDRSGYVHNVDDAPVLASGQQTTTAITIPGSALDYSSGVMSADIGAAVQTVVNRPGWSSGNAITFRLHGANSASSSVSVSAISLTIVYVDPAQEVTVTEGAALWAVTGPTVAPGTVTLTPTGVTLWALTGPVVKAAAVITPGAVSFWGLTGPTVTPAGAAALTAPSVAFWGLTAPTVTAAGAAVILTPTGASLWAPREPAVSRAYPDDPAPPDWQIAVTSPAYLKAVHDTVVRATMSVDVLTKDASTVLARFGGPHKRGPYAPTHAGFETISTSWGDGFTAELTTRDPSLLPMEGGLLAPFTYNQVRVWWWLLRHDATWMRIPIGTGTVDTSPVNDDDGFVLSIIVKDLMADIALAKWNRSVPVAGKPVSTAQAMILQDRAPWAETVIAPTVETVPEDWAHGDPDSDPTEDLRALAYAAGAWAGADRMGRYVNEPLDKTDAGIRARFATGKAVDGVTRILSIDTAMVSKKDVVNSVTFRSASSDIDPPVSGSWQIDDPNHPLWVGNRLFSRDLSNALMTTAEQCVTASRNYVMRNAVVQKVTFSHPPRPDLDRGDLVEITDAKAGVTGTWRITHCSLDGPLGPQTTEAESERMWF